MGGVGYAGIRENDNNRIEHLKGVADELGLRLIGVDTNEAEYYKGIRHVETHSLRTLSQILILQKLFAIYYFSSGFASKDFKISSEGSAYYDLFTIPLLSTETVSFYSHDAKTSRIEKIKCISKYPVSYDKLTVCLRTVSNCGTCEKCKRTMLELDLLGKLDLYKNSFDVSQFKKNKTFFLIESISRRKKKQFWQEIFDGYKERGQINFSILLWGNLFSLLPEKYAEKLFNMLESSGKSTVIKAALRKLRHK